MSINFFPPFLVAIVVFFFPIRQYLFSIAYLSIVFFIVWVVIAALFFVDIIDGSINYV